MPDLASTPVLIALGAGALALVALLLALVLAVKLRRVRRAQRVVLGDGSRDIVGHAARLQGEFDDLRLEIERTATLLHGRLGEAEQRLDGAIAYSSLVRYDAYNEMSGRQSTSIALLDASRSGLVLSSIHHRDQARLYAKQVHDGRPELELSPEEAEAMRRALDSAEPGLSAAS